MTYRDHSNSNELDDEKLPVSTKGGVYIPFPEKLFNMLQYIDLQEPELANIVSWQPHGRSFLVHDVPRFESIILPRFFAHNRNSSFLRQLNLWNFKRLRKRRGMDDYGAYYNEFFLRSKKFLHRNMPRRTQKNKGSVDVLDGDLSPSGVGFDDNHQQSSADALDAEPNFYSIAAMPPSAPYLEAVKSAEGPRGPEAAGALCTSSRATHVYPCYNNQEAICYTTEPVLPTTNNYRHQSAVSGELGKNILSLEYVAKEATT